MSRAGPSRNIARTCGFPAPISAAFAVDVESLVFAVLFSEAIFRKGAFTMQVEYTGRQVTVTRNLRTIAEEALERIVKILGKTTGVHVILTAEKYRQMAEVTIKTRLHDIVATSESTSLETALRGALEKAETQAIRCKKKLHAKKRQPKEEKTVVETALARPKRAASRPPVPEEEAQAEAPAKKANGNGRSKQVLPVTVHSFPAK